MIDGRPDDGLRMAAMFLGFGVFCLYGVYLACLGIIKVIVSIPGGAKSDGKESKGVALKGGSEHRTLNIQR